MKLLLFAIAVWVGSFWPISARAQSVTVTNSNETSSIVSGCGQNSGSAEAPAAVPQRNAENQQAAPGAQGNTPPAPVDADSSRHSSEPGNCVPPHTDPANCAKEQLVSFETGYHGRIFGEIPIWRNADSNAFFYVSGMTIDADGAPNAYHPDNIGLDDLSNAGGPGSWPGLAKDEHGEPIIQGPNDPYPGYYISATALSDHGKAFNDPTRYVDATKIPFIVLPGELARQGGARTGDFAVVFNLRNGKSSPAIFADVGPSDHLGEGSIALAENLGIRSDARNGGTRGGVAWLVFAGSGNGRPRPVEEIASEANRLLETWGGAVRFNACVADETPAQ